MVSPGRYVFYVMNFTVSSSLCFYIQACVISNFLYRLHLHCLMRNKKTYLVLLLMDFMNLRENGWEKDTFFWQSKGIEF